MNPALLSLEELPSSAQLATIPIRDLVDRFPRVMEVLTPLGIDLCCGGAHPLGEALDLHGLDREGTIEAVARVIAGQA